VLDELSEPDLMRSRHVPRKKENSERHEAHIQDVRRLEPGESANEITLELHGWGGSQVMLGKRQPEYQSADCKKEPDAEPSLPDNKGEQIAPSLILSVVKSRTCNSTTHAMATKRSPSTSRSNLPEDVTLPSFSTSARERPANPFAGGGDAEIAPLDESPIFLPSGATARSASGRTSAALMFGGNNGAVKLPLPVQQWVQPCNRPVMHNCPTLMDTLLPKA